MDKFTKVVATIGPSCDTQEKIKELYENGMSVARLNFSHGDYDYFDKVIENIKSVSEDIAILLDTKGPEIRTGDLNEEVPLSEGDNVAFTPEETNGDEGKITINYPMLSNVGEGSRIMLDDGHIEVEVTGSNSSGELQGKVISGGRLGGKKTVSIRGHDVELEFMTEKDKEDVLYGIEKQVDFVAASFVRTSKDLQHLREFINHYESKSKIIAKVEHPKALDNIKEIAQEADGVMVARGDLGVELPLEKVPLYQKELITICNKLCKPVIVATQMLETMKDSPQPTRAEVADVANAILQGTDAIMLSAETAMGKYPEKAVNMMSKIAREYESDAKSVEEKTRDDDYIYEEDNTPISSFITQAAYLATSNLNSKAIFTITETGFSARMVSRFKPNAHIYAVTKDLNVYRQLKLSRGVVPMYLEDDTISHDKVIDSLVYRAYKNGYFSKQDNIIFTAGDKLLKSGHTHSLEIYKVEWIIDRVENN